VELGHPALDKREQGPERRGLGVPVLEEFILCLGEGRVLGQALLNRLDEGVVAGLTWRSSGLVSLRTEGKQLGLGPCESPLRVDEAVGAQPVESAENGHFLTALDRGRVECGAIGEVVH